MDIVKVHYDEELQGVYGDDCRYLFDVSEKKLGEEVVKRINMHDELVLAVDELIPLFANDVRNEEDMRGVAYFYEPLER